MYQIIFMAFKNIPKLGFFGMQTYYASGNPGRNAYIQFRCGEIRLLNRWKLEYKAPNVKWKLEMKWKNNFIERDPSWGRFCKALYILNYILLSHLRYVGMCIIWYLKLTLILLKINFNDFIIFYNYNPFLEGVGSKYQKLASIHRRFF
jgi:hypothetical protein